MKVLLDHSIVGQQFTTLSIRKDREFAGCRICGRLFQSRLAIELQDEEWESDPSLFAHAVAVETAEWRVKHNKTHSEKEHRQLEARGLTFTPEAAVKLAPFGLVPILDAMHPEIAQALLEAPRAPVDDVDTTLKGWV